VGLVAELANNNREGEKAKGMTPFGASPSFI